MSSRASLNHIYRTVWNQALGAMVAVAEISTAGGRSASARIRSLELQQPGGTKLGLLALLVALAWGAMPGSALANPTGGVAVAGSATFVNNGNKLQVTTQNATGTKYSAINWQSFSIPAGSSTYFQQPDASSTSINRVVTNTPTQIFGSLSSNGNIVLVNQAGIAVGTGAVVDTNGFTASSLAMSDADAMAGRLRFGDGQISVNGVSVNGSVLARGGDVVLIGSNVNTGANAIVQAPNGSAVLAAGQQVEITGRGLEGISFQVQAPSDTAVNLGQLSGNAVGMFAGTLKHSGMIQATTATMEGGRVVLKAAGDAIVDGQARIAATGVHGGAVDVLGNRVAITDQASVDVSGQLGGGAIRVGGDFQGKNPDVQNATRTYLGAQASLIADATGSGNGGRVIVWSDEQTKAYGSISAQGGAQSGDGGFVEVSGKQKLAFEGKVNTLAAHGKAGTLLLDPDQIDVQNGGTGLITDVDQFSDLPGQPVTVSPATLNAVGGNVVLQATNDINFVDPVNLTTSNASLTAQAGGIINVGASITTNHGDILLTTDATGGSGGAIYVSAAITSGGGNITLHNSGADVGGNSIYLSADVNAGAGAVSLDTPSARVDQTAGGITASSLSVNASGAVDLKGSNAVGYFELTNSATTQPVALWTTGNLDLGYVTTMGDLEIKTNGGNLTQSDDLHSGGSGYSVTFNAGSGNIALTTGSNAIGGANVSLTGSAIGLHSSGDLIVSNLSRTGTHGLDLESGNGYVLTIPSGAIDTGSEDLRLVGSGSSFSTTGNLNGANITIAGYGITINHKLTTPGTVTLNSSSGGNISQVASTSAPNYILADTLTAQSAGAISLQHDSNVISHFSATASSTGLVSLWETGNLDLGAISTSGSINIKSNDGNITQSSTVTSGGTGQSASFNAGTLGSITLDNSANALGANISLEGKAITVYTGGALNVTSLTRHGIHALDLQANGGALTLPAGDIDTGSENLSLVSGTGLNVNDNLSGADIYLRGANGININRTIIASGNLKLDGGNGSISQPNPTSPANYLQADSLEALVSGYGSISLPNPSNQVNTLAAHASGSGGNSITYVGTAPTLEIGYVGNTYGLYASGNISVTNTGNIKINEDVYASGGSTTVALTASGAITHPDSEYNVITAGNGITLSATSIGASGGTSGYGGGVGYGNSVLVYPGSGDLIMSASSGNIYAFGTSNLNVGNVTATNGSVHLMSTYDMNLNGTITAGASGNAVVLDAADGYFTVGGYGGINLTTAGARWLLYAQDDGYGAYVSLNGLTPAFKQYGTYNDGTDSNVLGSGSGIIYYNNTGSATLGGTLTKVYDGTTTMPLTAGNISGFSSGVAGDSGGVYADSSASLDDPNVGASRTATLDWIKYTGVTASEGSGMTVYYAPYGVTASASVTPARAIVTVGGTGTRVYDGTNVVNASIFTLSGLVNGESLTLTGAGTVADKNVGQDKPVTLGTLALGDGPNGLASNYTIGSFTATITPMVLNGTISGITVDPRVYNGSTDAKLITSGSKVTTGLAANGNDVVGVSGGTGAYDTKNVGTAKPVSVNVTGMTLTGPDAGNYTVGTLTATGVTGDITPMLLSSATGVTLAAREYNGNTNASGTLTNVKPDGIISGDSVSLSGSASGTYTGADIGTHNVSLSGSGLTLGGTDAGNYQLAPNFAVSGSGAITVRQTSTWSGGAGTLNWSDAGNWDALPTGSNVSSVVIPGNVTVNFSGGDVHLNSLTVNGLSLTGGSLSLGALTSSSLAIASGSLSLGSALNVAQYAQTGGSFTGTGLTVTSGYSQTGGSVVMTGPVGITTQGTGPLTVGAMTAPTVTLASGGAIGQSGPLNVSGKLTTTSTGGTLLDNDGNHIAIYQGSNTGAGGISVTTHGPVDLQGITTTNGDVKVLNFGGITSNGAINAAGAVTLTANSPLTINAPINATGNIALVATNQTSEGNIVINGQVKSSGGSIAVAAASNYTQNGIISAAQGVTATAGGSMTFGPDALTTGHPVNFDANGTVVVPPGAAPTTGSTPTDFVATFLSNFQDAVSGQNSSSSDPDGKKKDKDVVVEGQTCAR